MTRRSFLRQAGATAATGGVVLGAPAIVHAQPTIRWRCPSSFSKSLDTLFGISEYMAKRVSGLTGGKFIITPAAAGEIVPAFGVLDAVQNGTVEMCHTAPYYFYGKDPTWAFGTAVPFGMNFRQYNAWWFHGGGDKIFNDFAAKAGIVSYLAGNTGVQMGGWYRKEIKTIEDLKGLKFRVGGFAGAVLAKLGVVPQQIPAGEIYAALEKGTIDAAEWVGPYDDEKLGLAKVAKFYYTPGWWEGGPALHTFVGQKALESLPPEYRAAIECATGEANGYLMAKYDALNPGAMRSLLSSGAQLRAFSKPVLDACYKAAQTVYEETAGKNAAFKTVHAHYFTFLKEQIAWQSVAESRFDQYMASVKR